MTRRPPSPDLDPHGREGPFSYDAYSNTPYGQVLWPECVGQCFAGTCTLQLTPPACCYASTGYADNGDNSYSGGGGYTEYAKQQQQQADGNGGVGSAQLAYKRAGHGGGGGHGDGGGKKLICRDLP